MGRPRERIRKQGGSYTSGSQRPTWRSLRRPAYIVAAYLLLWIALDVATENLSGKLDISLWYAPAGLSFALLLVCGVRYAPAVVLTMLVHDLLFRSGAEYPLWLLFALPVLQTVVWVGPAVLLVRAIKIDPRLSRIRDILYFVVIGCIVAPFIASVAGVVGYSVGGHLPWVGFVINTLGGWAGEATGVGMMTTLILIALRPYPSVWSTSSRQSSKEEQQPWQPLENFSLPARREIPEILGQGALLAATMFVAYGTDRGIRLDFAYLVFLPLIWVAIRNDLARTVACILIINVGALLLIGGVAENANPILIQFGLMTITIVGLLLGGLVTEQRETSKRLVREASHDRLTGLANRAMFSDTLANVLKRRSDDESFMVLAIDLDRFAQINNALGYRIGDRLLVDVGERLKAFVSEHFKDTSKEEPDGSEKYHAKHSIEDRTARIGGDTFAVLVGGISSAEEAGHETRRLLKQLARPYVINETEVHITASAGIMAVWAGSGNEECGNEKDTEDLLRNADIALRAAKARGLSRCVTFDRTMGEATSKRLALGADLRQAIECEELTLYYQPIFSSNRDEVAGFEALLRWNHPKLGLLLPGEFVPSAEQGGMIVPIGEWVLREACRWAKQWQEMNSSMPPIMVSVNLSARQLERPNFAGDVEMVLKETGLRPGSLVLEVTESVMIDSAGSTADTLTDIREQGVRLAADDFGTGYSSLSYLNRFSLDIIKLDRSFVGGLSQTDTLEESASGEKLVSGIVDLAHSLDIEIVAEGVENDRQLEHLQDIGCDMLQGYYLSEPLAPKAASTFLKNEAR